MNLLKRWIDRHAIKMAARMLAPVRPHLAPDERAVERINDPLLLQPPAAAVTDFTFSNQVDFSFPSQVTTGVERVDRCHGKFFAAVPGSPAVILVHGWNAEFHYLLGFPRLAKMLTERGISALMFELPYHMQRRPKAPAEVRDFISDSLSTMLLATRQAIADIEALARWARGKGSARVGIWGFSLGAWLAGLHLTQSDAADAAVLTTPVSDLKIAIETLPFCFPIRAALQRTHAPVERLNLASSRPRIAPENILVTEALYDQFVPARTYSELARSWQLGSWQKVPQSHISILASRPAMRSAADWLESRLLPRGS